jgi:hypothetical protein
MLIPRALDSFTWGCCGEPLLNHRVSNGSGKPEITGFALFFFHGVPSSVDFSNSTTAALYKSCHAGWGIAVSLPGCKEARGTSEDIAPRR